MHCYLAGLVSSLMQAMVVAYVIQAYDACDMLNPFTSSACCFSTCVSDGKRAVLAVLDDSAHVAVAIREVQTHINEPK